MKSKKFNLKEEYKESWSYIIESKKFIYFIVSLFFIFTLIGFFIPAPESVSEQIFKFIKELLEKTEGMSQGELVRFIFFNNLQSSFFGMIFGILLGIFPFFAAVANGYLLGFVASITVENGGFITLWRVLPHGIFELPAIFISLGLGLKMGLIIFQKGSFLHKFESLRRYFWNSLKVFLFIVLPLLITAAIIEGTLISLYG